MELQFERSELRCLSAAVREVRGVELTQETKLPEGMPDIGRVLTSWGQCVIRSKEWNRDEITVTGGLMVWISYLPEDGTEVRSVEGWIPFQIKWDVDPSAREGAIRVMPLVRFVDSRGISGRKLMTRAGISVRMQAMSPMTAEIFTPGELPEDVEVLLTTYPVRIPREAGERTFLLDEELTLPGNAVPMERILSVSLAPVVTEQKVLGTRLVFKGNGNLHVVYRCPEGRVRNVDLELPFSQFAELEGEYGPDSVAETSVAVTSLETDMMEPGQLRLKAGLVGQYLVEERQMLEVTEDAYSPFREVSLKMDTLAVPSVLEDRRELIHGEQSIPGQSGQGADVNFLPDFPRLRRTGQGVEAELPGLFQVLYYGEDDALQAANARWEGVIPVPAGEETQLDMEAWVLGTPEALPGVDALNLRGQLQLRIRSTAQTRLPMVTGLELGDLREREETRPTLVFCRAGTEGLWSLAKRCCSTVAAIRAANDLQTEPVDNRMLLIPVS